MDRTGLSRSNTTGYTATYSRPLRAGSLNKSTDLAKPLPTVPGVASVKRSNSVMKSGFTSRAPVVPSKEQPAPPPKATITYTRVPSSKAPFVLSKPPAAYVKPNLPNDHIGLQRSNTAPIRPNVAPTRAGTVPNPLPSPMRGLTTQPSIISKRSASPTPARNIRDPAPSPPLKSPPVTQPRATMGLLRSRSDSQRPTNTFASKNEAVKALKQPLPVIPHGAVGSKKNLVIAAEENARVLDSGLPSVTSSHIVRVAESGGQCLKEAGEALYGRALPPPDRIIWNRTAEGDRQMKAFLEWIDNVKWGLASLGLHKFMETKERGALIFNINGRLSNSPQTPAVDWINFQDAQKTLEVQLQQFIATYDPTTHVLVFVFRVMPSKDRLHIWGKKIQIPSNLPSTYASELQSIMKKINKKKFRVLMEDEPPKRSLSLANWLKRRITH